jgi:hypothetical protein
MNKITTLLLSGIITVSIFSAQGLTQSKQAPPDQGGVPSTQEKLQAVTGTKISLIPPAGFVASTRFAGYQQDKSNSSILVTEIPAPIDKLQPGLTNDEELQKKGMVLLKQEPVTVNGQEALLLNIKQSAYGTDFKKWILLLGNETESVLVTATFLEELEAEYSESLKNSLLTVEWNQTATATTDNLQFTLIDTGDLKLAQKMGNALAYTKDGVFPAPSIDDPIFIVAPSISPQYQEVETFARSRLSKTENLTEIEIETENKITIDNLDGYEILAVGKDVKSGEQVALYQVVLLDRDAYYYLMQGQVNARLNSQYLSQFKQLARSFKRK